MSFDNYNFKPEFIADIPARIKSNVIYSPVAGETLEIYLKRANTQISHVEQVAINAHIYGAKVWWCHRQAGDCFICLLIQINGILRDILLQIPSSGKCVFDSNKNLKFPSKSQLK